MGRSLSGGSLLLAWVAAWPSSAQTAGAVVTVRQEEDADFRGSDHGTLRAALERLRNGGTLLLGPGRYVVRQTLFLPPDLVLRGEPGAVLALPSPGVTRAAARAGARELQLERPGEFGTDGKVGILPPAGSETFADGETRYLGPCSLAAVEGAQLALVEPLALDVPAGSRVSYPIKLLFLPREGRVTIENLAFEGGRVADLPMQGHFVHCAIWASSPSGLGPKEPVPPARDVIVRHCRFSGWYGRAIALYHTTDSLVEGCLFEGVADEAIDLDHYCERVRVAGNDVRDAIWGIVLNDASRCTVEYNRVEDCEVGIYNWWFDQVPLGGINEENVIRHNVVRRARQAAIQVDRECHRNVVESNFVDGEVRIVEPTNRVAGNTRLQRP